MPLPSRCRLPWHGHGPVVWRPMSVIRQCQGHTIERATARAMTHTIARDATRVLAHIIARDTAHPKAPQWSAQKATLPWAYDWSRGKQRIDVPCHGNDEMVVVRKSRACSPANLAFCCLLAPTRRMPYQLVTPAPKAPCVFLLVFQTS